MLSQIDNLYDNIIAIVRRKTAWFALDHDHDYDIKEKSLSPWDVEFFFVLALSANYSD